MGEDNKLKNYALKEELFHDFDFKNNQMKELRKALDYLYKEIHGFKIREVEDRELQLLGCDILCKKDDIKIIVDEKIQIQEFNFKNEMLLEIESRWYSSDKLYKTGWAQDMTLINDWIVEYNPSSKRFFIYDAKKLKDIVTSKGMNNLETVEENFPGVYVRKSKSKYMYTLCIIVPREYLNKACIQTGILCEF